MDRKEVITNPSLVEAIAKMQAKQTNETMDAMVTEVMAAHFLAPVEMELEEQGDADGTLTIKKDTTMRFHTLQSKDGDRYLMAFTDWEQLHRWKGVKHVKTVVLQFDDYAAMILREGSNLAGFVINAFGENVPFTLPLIQILKEQKEKGHREHVVKKGESIILGDPKEYPHELVHALKKYMKKDKHIHAAYLQFMIRGKKESWLIALDFDGIRDAVFKGVADIARPFLHGMVLDLISLDDSREQASDVLKPLYQALVAQEPFYKEMFYKRPVIKEDSIAIIEETFAIKDEGCVLGCHIQQGSFAVKEEVDVLNGNGEQKFQCTIDGIENKSGRVDKIVHGRDDNKAGMLVRAHSKDEFQAGYVLRKRC